MRSRLRSRGRAATVSCVVVLVTAGCNSAADPAVTGSPAAPASTGAMNTAAREPRSVGPQQFADVIAEPDRVTINVHVPYEGDIPGTDITVAFDQIAAQVDRLPTARTTPLAVYCRTGRMSRIAATTLSNLGYQDVVELEGGMQAWQQSGRTLIWR